MHYNFEVLTRKLLLKVVTKVEILNHFQSCAAARLDILISLQRSSFTVQVEIEVLYLNTKVLTRFQNRFGSGFGR